MRACHEKQSPHAHLRKPLNCPRVLLSKGAIAFYILMSNVRGFLGTGRFLKNFSFFNK